jgi:serine protease AprX
VGAPAVWNSATAPATGRGVTVAVLDTGVNVGHPDFAHGGLRAVNVNRQARDAADPHGHGTHVIGTIKGRDASGRYLGIAPDARVISVKIADDAGVARESDLLRGLQWVYNQRLAENIRVVSLSVSAGVPTSYRTSPTAAAVEQLWRGGIVVVAASGNRGDALDATWQAPGNDPYVVTVGCLDDDGTAAGSDDALCSFSSRGTTPDGYAKPDVVAPGRRIVSTLAASDATVAQLYPDRVTDREYIRLSGTSMSTPVVSGVVALLLERYPALTPNQVKWLLTSTAKPYPGRPDQAGLVFAPAVLSRAALGNVGSANQGLTPSLGLTLLGSLLNGGLLWGSAYWDSAYWDSAYWDSAYWDSAYWDSAD